MKSLIENKELYMLMVEASPNALILTNKKGEIIHINKYAEKLFQYSKQEIVGQKVELLVPDKFTDKHPINRNEYLKRNETRPMGLGRDLFAQRKDKTKFPAEIGLNPILIDGDRLVLATVIDISERKEHENEINLRNRKLAELSETLKQTNIQLEIQNRNINQSIEYARKIQLSILPEQLELQKHLHDFALFYAPKDIIGGDFYWFKQRDNVSYLAAIDCTGHGVPGAMLSILISSLLNEVYEEIPEEDTGEQLALLHRKLYHFLQQEKGEDYSQDGCDISLCKIDSTNKTIQYSGARQHLYLNNGKEINIIKATSKSIGGFSALGLPDPNRSFNTDNIKLTSPTVVALTTDGIIDQLDKNDRVFGYENFKNAISQNESSSKLIEKLAEKINFWKTETEQLDDMLSIVFKL